MIHPLFAASPREMATELRELTIQEKVKKTSCGEAYDIFKYADAKRIEGVARLARGLVMSQDGLRFVTLPMPKFDEVCAFDPNAERYYERVHASLPEVATVQPKHDGTCIVAKLDADQKLITTLGAFDNDQITQARALLADAHFDPDVTYMFELIWERDPKVQTKRSPDGLYLFYGMRHTTGVELAHHELGEAATRLGVNLVKQQKKKRAGVMQILRNLDDIDEIRDIKEGVVILHEGQRYKVKSWWYMQCASGTLPSRSWLSQHVRTANTVCDIQEAVDASRGLALVLDATVVAHRLWCALLEEASRVIDACKVTAHATPDEVKQAPQTLQPFLFKMMRDEAWIDTDAALLFVLKCLSKPESKWNL